MKKLQFFLSLLLCLAVNHIWAAPVASPSDIQEGKIYTISTSSRGSIIWNGTDDKLESTKFSSSILDSSNPNHQFTFIKKEGETDKFYMVNIGADKFVYQSSNRAALTEMSLALFTIKISETESYPLMIDAASGDHWNLDNTGYVFIDTWSTKDAGNCFAFEEVGDAEETYVTELKTRIETAKSYSKITYTSTDGQVVTPTVSAFGSANIISNTYSGGKGTIEFDNIITTFSYNCFQNCSTLKTVNIPKAVTSIEGIAFKNCSELLAINVPDNVTSIGEAAFYGCTKLALAILPKNLNSIPQELFYQCSSLTSITLPNSVKSIGEAAFCKCSSLVSITIPNSVTSIERATFFGCSSLTSITIPNSVTSIGNEAFDHCSSLASVTIGNSVTSIGECAFFDCSILPSITIPNSVTSIGDYAFWKCSSLTSISIPNSVTHIGTSPFEDCSKLQNATIHIIDFSNNNLLFDVISPSNISYCYKEQEITGAFCIPDSTTTLGKSVLRGCNKLTSITIPNSVTSIGDYAFRNCSDLISIDIPNSVITMGPGAFQNCSKLNNVIVPNSLTELNSDLFYGCWALTSITIPASVTTIKHQAFLGCGFTSFTIPNSVKTIGDGAFSWCGSLTSVTFPISVTTIDENAFFKCSNLTSITNLATKPQTINSNTFSTYSGITLHVYEGYKSVYQNDAVWGQFTISDDVPTIKATSIKLSSPVYYCNTGDVLQPKAIVSEDATFKDVTWTSSNPAVLYIVDANTGEAFGISEGEAIITATTTDGSALSASATVHVCDYTPVTSISINPHASKVVVNEPMILTATVLPTSATQKAVTWTSLNPEVATVNELGEITTVSLGNAVIVAGSSDGTLLADSCEIRVVNPNVFITNQEDQLSRLNVESDESLSLLDNIKSLSITDTIPSVNLSYTRNFTDAMVGNWQAWYMPCDFDYDDLSEDFDVAVIAGILLDGNGDSYVAFKKMTEGTVKAHTPYVVRAKEAGDAVITATTTLQPTSGGKSFSIQSAFNNFTFGGVYENSYLSAEQPSYALNKSGNFALMSESVYLRPFRIYMRIADREDNPYVAVTAPQEVKVVVLGEDETSVDEIHNSQFIIHNDESSEIYNLGGQKLQKLQKGINIVNGRKVLY